MIEFNPTKEEIIALRDSEWTDSIQKYFPNFNVEKIELSQDDLNNLSFSDRWIKMLKIHLENK
jgi:hypothetical protein